MKKLKEQIFLLVIPFLLNYTTNESKQHKRSVTNSRYYLKRIIWDKRVLTYSLFGNSAAKNQTKFKTLKNSLRESFDEWQNNSCFKFIDQTPSKLADIKIIFTNDQYAAKIVTDPLSLNYTHQNCERRLKGRAGHAFFRYHKKFPAQIHMNNEIFWMESKPSGGISLKTVLLHEIGHVLGLFHSDMTDSVMYEYIFTNQIKHINQIDKQDLYRIYSILCQKKTKMFKLRKKIKIVS